MALHEATWCRVVWCTQNAPRRQQLHVVTAVSTPFRWIFKKRYKKLFTHVASLASAVSLFESGEAAKEKRSTT